MIGKNILVLAALWLLLVPGTARASFFDDGRWYMGSEWWDDLSAWNTDPQDRIDVRDANNRLNLTTPGWPGGWQDGYSASDGFVSKAIG